MNFFVERSQFCDYRLHSTQSQISPVLSTQNSARHLHVNNYGNCWQKNIFQRYLRFYNRMRRANIQLWQATVDSTISSSETKNQKFDINFQRVIAKPVANLRDAVVIDIIACHWLPTKYLAHLMFITISGLDEKRVLMQFEVVYFGLSYCSQLVVK